MDCQKGVIPGDVVLWILHWSLFGGRARPLVPVQNDNKEAQKDTN
jgi:hypothetical protein